MPEHENTWEIIDKNGCVFSGTEDRMREIWNTIVSGNETDIEWDGDMKLVEIHDLYN